MFYTDRLMLRPMDAGADLKHFTRWLNDQDILLGVSANCPLPSSAAAVKAFVEKSLLAPKNEPPYQFVVCFKPPPEEMPERLGHDDDLFLKKDGSARYPFIGHLNFHAAGFSWSNKCMSFGLALEREHRNKGYGTEVIRWACKYVFDFMGMHRFELRARDNNSAAKRCYEKIGFVTEGVQREAYFYDGKYGDILLMGLLERDWRKAQEA